MTAFNRTSRWVMCLDIKAGLFLDTMRIRKNGCICKGTPTILSLYIRLIGGEPVCTRCVKVDASIS